MSKEKYKYYPLMMLPLVLHLLRKGIPDRKIMTGNKFISLVLLMALSSCVKVYSPKIKSTDLNKYVVSGSVTAGAQTQTVSVSTTSSINQPSYKPLTGCNVTILDDQNNSFPLTDMGNGDYSTLIDPKYMVPGRAFKVIVVVPDGDSLVSDYDTLSVGAPIDSIYYRKENIESPLGGPTSSGIQFYLNYKGSQTESHYYKWNIYETWEYHAEYPLEYWWDGTMHHNIPPDSSRFTCWHTRKIPEIYTLSTASLSQNQYKGIKLQFVDNTTPKLANGYSMLVEQMALSKSAFNYWDQLRTNSTQQGGLYEKQPIVIQGNLRDVSHPGKEVLGFFGAVSASFKRIFISHVPGLTLHYIIPCKATVLRDGFIMISSADFPAPILAGPTGPEPVLLSSTCVNCLLQGGTNVKPSFWPN